MRIPKGILKIGKIAAPVDPDVGPTPMSGVRVSRAGEKCIAECTDGRRAIHVTFVEPAHDDVFDTVANEESVDGCVHLIPAKASCEVDKGIKPSPGYAILDEASNDEKIALFNPSLSQLVKCETAAVPGEFPNVYGVIPKYTIGKDAVRLTVNGDALVGLLKAIMDASNDVAVVFEIPTTDRPMKISSGLAENGSEVIGILMPIKNEA